MLERLQKVVARAGVSSRRAAEKLIVDGRVRVNGRVTTELGTRVNPGSDRVEVDGRRLVAEAPVYLVLNKPRGAVSTLNDPEGRPTVRDLVSGVRERVFPVGRLDYGTSGVLLLTNDGDFCNRLLHPRRDAPKTYVVKLSGQMPEPVRKRWEEGIDLEDGKTRPAEVNVLRHEQGKTWLSVTLHEGKNQQIRRMAEATGFTVMRLSRTDFAGIGSEGLRPGEWRALSSDELVNLQHDFGVPRRLPKASGAPTPPPRKKRLPGACPGSFERSSKPSNIRRLTRAGSARTRRPGG
jgi:23S rRNA pseudouridine2605 synthase